MYHLNPLAIPRKNSSTILLCADYQFENGTQVFFTVKIQPDGDETDADALIKVSWTVGTDANYDADGNLVLELTPEQTDIAFDKYYYDIKTVTEAGVATTVIFGELTILPVVTLRS